MSRAAQKLGHKQARHTEYTMPFNNICKTVHCMSILTVCLLVVANKVILNENRTIGFIGNYTFHGDVLVKVIMSCCHGPGYRGHFIIMWQPSDRLAT